MNKSLPYNNDAEKSVLASIIIDSDAIFEVNNYLEVEDFFVQQNQIIYEIFLKLIEKGVVIDQITVAQELANEGKLESIGGVSYLSQLVVALPTSTHIESYAQIVKRLSTARRIISSADRVAASGYEASEIEDMMSKVESIIDELRSDLSEPRLLTPDLWARKSIDRYTDLYNKKSSIALSTGFEQLDYITGGIFPGEFRVIAGYAGVGKTSIAEQQAEILQRFGNTLFVSLEMSHGDIKDRQVSSLLDMKLRTIRSGGYKQELFDKIVYTVGETAEYNIYFYPYYPENYTRKQFGISVSDIYSIARQLKQTKGLKSIVVDYLQLLTEVGDTRYEQITLISKQLQNLARSLNVPVICLCQLNRNIMHRTNINPQKSDLLGSGSIEQDADTIVFVHRHSLSDFQFMEIENRIPDDEAVLILAKIRQGDEGTSVIIPLIWDSTKRLYREKKLTETKVPSEFL